MDQTILKAYNGPDITLLAVKLIISIYYDYKQTIHDIYYDFSSII